MNLVSSKERLLQYLDYKKIDRPKFYEKTGIKRGLLDKDKLKSALTDYFIATIIERFEDLNPIWLLTGNGYMLIEEKSTNVSIIDPNDTLFVKLLDRIEILAAENARLKNEISVLAKQKKVQKSNYLSIASEP